VTSSAARVCGRKRFGVARAGAENFGAQLEN